MTDMTESTELQIFKRQKDGYKVTVKIKKEKKFTSSIYPLVWYSTHTVLLSDLNRLVYKDISHSQT